MRVFEKETFERFYDQDSGGTFEDMEFRKCRFESCAVSIAKTPERRSTFRRVRLVQCEERGCAVYAGILEDVLVDGLKTSDLLFVRGAAFKHVSLKGKIDRVMVTPSLGKASPEQQRAFDAANAAYYEGVDWAVDVSEGQFVECSLQGIPARLIRRDPDTQVVVTREKAARGEWRKLDLARTYWPEALEAFLQRGDPDVVLIAGTRDREWRGLVDGLRMLQETGVAEAG